MFDKIKKAVLGDPSSIKKSRPTASSKKKKSEKEIATEAGEPWVSVLGMELDTDSLERGAFELDWNDIFIAKLVRAGYQGKEDADLVDQWFQDVCRNVVLESFEKEQAMGNVENIDEHRNAYK
jgi:hypothetical protein